MQRRRTTVTGQPYPQASISPRGIVRSSYGTGLAVLLQGRRRKAGSGTYLLPKGRRQTRGEWPCTMQQPILSEEFVMFMMTETAGEYLTAVLDNANVPDETAIRLVLEGGTLTPQLDNARLGDEKFDHAGRMVLILDTQVSQVLDNSTLDVEATDEGPKLILLPRTLFLCFLLLSAKGKAQAEGDVHVSPP